MILQGQFPVQLFSVFNVSCKKHDGGLNTVSFDLQNVAKLINKYRLVEAFIVIKRSLDKKMEDIIAILSNVDVSKDKDVSLAWSYINTMVILLIQLCQKHHSKDLDIPSSDKDKIWFELLESIIKPQRILSKQRGVVSKCQLQPFKDAVKHVVKSALGYVSLRTLIETIVTDQV